MGITCDAKGSGGKRHHRVALFPIRQRSISIPPSFQDCRACEQGRELGSCIFVNAPSRNSIVLTLLGRVMGDFDHKTRCAKYCSSKRPSSPIAYMVYLNPAWPSFSSIGSPLALCLSTTLFFFKKYVVVQHSTSRM